MRSSQDVKAELEELIAEHGKDETKYDELIAGWVESLKWVLSVE